MMYRQITAAERYTLKVLQVQGFTPAVIARALGRHRSSITRELARNRTHYDDYYRPQLADWYARGRRSRSRRNTRFTPADWARVDAWLGEDWSPEQIAGWCARFRLLAISHETIYRHIWRDKRRGGTLHVHLAARTSRSANATAPMTAAGGSPASGRSPRARPAPSIDHASATGKATRCSGTARRGRAS